MTCFFKECEEDRDDDEIEKLRDGKYYKRIVPGSEIKLKNGTEELESELKDTKKKLKEWIRQ